MSRASFFAGAKQGAKSQMQLAKEEEKKRKAAHKRKLAREVLREKQVLARIKRDEAVAKAEGQKYKSMGLFSQGRKRR